MSAQQAEVNGLTALVNRLVSDMDSAARARALPSRWTVTEDGSLVPGNDAPTPHPAAALELQPGITSP